MAPRMMSMETMDCLLCVLLPPPLEAGEGCGGHQCRHHCDNGDDNDSHLCRDSHLIQSVLTSITSWEHMVPIVAEGTFLLGPRRPLFGKSVSNNNSAVQFYSALCFAESILSFLLFFWSSHSFVAHGPRKNLASDKCN